MEPIDPDNPRDALERSEETSVDPHRSDLVTALSAILAWIVEAAPAGIHDARPGHDLAHVGLRAMVAAAKVRPEMVDGATLHELGQPLNISRAAVHKVARQFSEVFGIRGTNDKGRPFDRYRRNPRSAEPALAAHLGILNRWRHWQRLLAAMRPTLTSAERRQLRQDFAPLRAFLADLERGIDLKNEPPPPPPPLPPARVRVSLRMRLRYDPAQGAFPFLLSLPQVVPAGATMARRHTRPTTPALRAMHPRTTATTAASNTAAARINEACAIAGAHS